MNQKTFIIVLIILLIFDVVIPIPITTIWMLYLVATKPDWIKNIFYEG